MHIIYKFLKLDSILLWASLDKNVKHNIHPCKYNFVDLVFLSYKIPYI